MTEATGPGNTATCLCGSVHIRIDKIVGTGICHCNSCRKMTSSAFSMNSPVRTEDFHLVRGSPKKYLHTNHETGNSTTFHFCDICSSLMWIEFAPMPELKVIKSGILDGDLTGLKPAAEQFIERRPEWLCAVAEAMQIRGQQGAESVAQAMDELAG